MYNIISNYDENSIEYKELDYRIKCLQDLQQAEIDKSKGCIARPVPKEWYDYKTNKIDETDSDKIKSKKELNLSILANKKPYFFVYNYQKLKSEWNEYKISSNDFCLIKFDCDIQELINKDNKTKDEQEFINSYYLKSPVNLHECTMNKVARLFESEFDGNNRYHTKGFDKEKFKSNAKYTEDELNQIKKIKKQYENDVRESIKCSKRIKDSNSYADNETSKRTLLAELNLNVKSTGINDKVLCNIIVDLCYTSDKSKSFAWDLVGNLMVENLINNTKNKIKFPVKDEDGDIEYCGKRFTLMEVVTNENNL